eukprot:6206254-Pleurochrysis_carterae.AAC.1
MHTLIAQGKVLCLQPISVNLQVQVIFAPGCPVVAKMDFEICMVKALGVGSRNCSSSHRSCKQVFADILGPFCNGVLEVCFSSFTFFERVWNFFSRKLPGRQFSPLSGLASSSCERHSQMHARPLTGSPRRSSARNAGLVPIRSWSAQPVRDAAAVRRAVEQQLAHALLAGSSEGAVVGLTTKAPPNAESCGAIARPSA